MGQWCCLKVLVQMFGYTLMDECMSNCHISYSTKNYQPIIIEDYYWKLDREHRSHT